MSITSRPYHMVDAARRLSSDKPSAHNSFSPPLPLLLFFRNYRDFRLAVSLYTRRLTMDISATTSAATASVLAVLMHHGLFIHGEWHLQAPTIVTGHIFAFVLLLVNQYYSEQRSWHDSIVPAVAYLSSLISSIAIYRLYFHRLRAFPGPRLAALSKLWHVYMCRDSRGHHVLEDLYQRYGPMVRTGPNEITLFHSSAYETMDSAKNRNKRSDWYDLLYPRISSIFTRDRAVHDARRKVWDQAMSSSCKYARAEFTGPRS